MSYPSRTYAFLFLFIVFIISFAASVQPSSAWMLGWYNRKKLTLNASATLDHTNDFFIVNVSGIRLATNNCTREIRLTNTSDSEMDFIVIDDGGQALGDGDEWCIIGFNATVDTGTDVDLYVYYNNTNATKPAYLDEELGFPSGAAGWMGGRYMPNDGYGWSTEWGPSIATNMTVPEEGYRWYIYFNHLANTDGVYTAADLQDNCTLVFRMNTSDVQPVTNDWIFSIGNSTHYEYLAFSTTGVKLVNKSTSYGLDGTSMHTYKAIWNSTGGNVTLWVFNSTTGNGWSQVFSATGIGATGSNDVRFGDAGSTGESDEFNAFIDFMGYSLLAPYPPLNHTFDAEETSMDVRLWLNGTEADDVGVYGESFNMTATINITLPLGLYVNGTLINNDTSRVENSSDVGWFKNATYNITAVWEGNATFNPGWITRYIRVAKNTTVINQSVNGTEGNTTFVYNQTVNVTAWKDMDSGTLTIERNGSVVSNPSIEILGAAAYNFTVSLSDENHSAVPVSWFVTVNPSYAANSINASPSWSEEENTQITITANSNVSHTFYKDGVVITSPYTATLAFGVYNFTLVVTGGGNYSNPTMTQWLSLTTGGFGCTDHDIYAFSKAVIGGNVKMFNFTELVALSYVKPDLSDVWVNTSNMTAWRNQTNSKYYMVVNASNVTSFTMKFGNYMSNLTWQNSTNDTDIMVNLTSLEGYSSDYPYYVITMLEETTGAQQLPPAANRTMILYCPNGISRFSFNQSKLLVATFDQIDQIRAMVAYSLTDVYFRSLIVRSDVEYRNMYLVDANENQVVQMLIELQDSTGDFGGSIFKVKKNLEGSYETITENYFDAENKVLVYLINGDRYSIYVDNGDEERSIGDFYVDSVDLTKTLYLTDVYDMNLTTVGNISYHLYRRNATGYNDAIILNYFDAANQTRNVTMTVYNATNSSQAALYTVSSLNHSTVQFIYAVPDVNGSYRVSVHVSHLQFGEGSWPWEDIFGAVVGLIAAPQALPGLFPAGYVQTLGFVLIMSVPMLFSPPTGATAGVFVVLIASLLAFWNWYPINIVILIFGLALAVLNKVRSKT